MVFLAAALLHFAGGQSWKAADLEGPYDVVRVVDGDTVRVNINGEETKVRMIGVNTPESVASDESRNTPEGEVASEYTKSLLEGKQVYLEYDEERYDKYGRTLAYIYLDDGKTMVEELLLEGGYAEVMIIPPNDRYETRFRDIAEEAPKPDENLEN